MAEGLAVLDQFLRERVRERETVEIMIIHYTQVVAGG